MTDEMSAPVSLAVACPTEVLLNIFSYLNIEQLSKCREVCWRWRSLVEDNELFWRRRCEVEFKENYKAAYHKREEGLSWFGLYRSLSLWSKIKLATYEMCTFTHPTGKSLRQCCSIDGFQLLSRGEVGIFYRWKGIVYYDTETLQESRRENIPGEFVDYVENDDFTLLSTRNRDDSDFSDLHVIRKVTTPRQQAKRCISTSVRTFFLTEDVVYYVKSGNQDNIYTCNLSDDKLESSLLLRIPDGVMAMGCTNGFLCVLMKKIPYEIGIFNVNGPCPVRVDIKPNLAHLLIENDHLQNRFCDLRFWPWNDMKQTGLAVEVIKIYGDIIFIGVYAEEFLMFYVPHLENRLDIFHTPGNCILHYNFYGGGRFRNIDVVERNDGHTVLVGMNDEIVVFKFYHEFVNFNTFPVR